MINLELIAYIEGARRQGVSDAEIMRALTQEGGWSSSDVREAFGVANLPAGSIQIAEFRAAKLRAQHYAERRSKRARKGFQIIMLLALIGGCGYFITIGSERQYAVITAIMDIPSYLTTERLNRFAVTFRSEVDQIIDRAYTVVLSYAERIDTTKPAAPTATTTGVALTTNSAPTVNATTTSSVTITTRATSTARAASTAPIECGSREFSGAAEAASYISSSSCFAKAFSTCSPARLAATTNGYTTRFSIEGRSAELCLVREDIFGASLAQPVTLSCAFTASSSWKEAEQSSSRVCSPAAATSTAVI